MSAVTMETRDNRSGGFIFLIIILAIILFSILFAISYSPHATEKHGSMATSVRQCLDNGGTMEVWLNDNTGREAHLCKIGEKFGLQIQKDGREITSFIKDKMNHINQVYRYLSNKGYTTRIK